MKPIYTPENTKPAFQLNWSVSLFGNDDLPMPNAWLNQLKQATESDGVRILEYHAPKSTVGQVLISSSPKVSPSDIIRSVKGRWQYLAKTQYLKLFRRNYCILSVGDAKSEVLDRYIARQTSRHPMVDPIVQKRLESLQLHDAKINLKRVHSGTYGRFVYNLHLVLENAGGWNEIREGVLAKSRAKIIETAEERQWRVSRIGLLSNHVHILVGASVKESPESVALALMNNLTSFQETKPLLRFSYYAGTFGPYDRDAVRRGLHLVQ